MLLYILIGLAAIVAIFVGIVASRPAEFRITRSATMNASPSVVFDQVNTMRNWEAWSPWAQIDPNAKTTYGGPPSGKDASFAWVGSRKLGEGSMTVVDSQPPERVRFRIDFLKPMKATNIAEFTFRSQGSQTLVTWSMWGNNNFVGKAFSLFVDFDKMCGRDFEKGLASLKSISEQQQPVPSVA